MAFFSFDPAIAVDAAVTTLKQPLLTKDEYMQFYQKQGAPPDAPCFLDIALRLQLIRKPPNSTVSQIFKQILTMLLVDGEEWTKTTGQATCDYKHPFGTSTEVNRNILEVRFRGPTYPTISPWGATALFEKQVSDEASGIFGYLKTNCSLQHEALVANCAFDVTSKSKLYDLLAAPKSFLYGAIIMTWAGNPEEHLRGVPSKIGVRKGRQDHLDKFLAILTDQGLLLDADTRETIMPPRVKAAPPAELHPGRVRAARRSEASTRSPSRDSSTSAEELESQSERVNIDGSEPAETQALAEPATFTNYWEGRDYCTVLVSLRPMPGFEPLRQRNSLGNLIVDALDEALYSETAERYGLNMLEREKLKLVGEQWMIVYADPRVATFLTKHVKTLSVVIPTAGKVRYNLSRPTTCTERARAPRPATVAEQTSTVPDKHGGAFSGPSQAVAPTLASTTPKKNSGKAAAAAKTPPPQPTKRTPRPAVETGAPPVDGDSTGSRHSARLSLKAVGRTNSIHQDQLPASPKSHASAVSLPESLLSETDLHTVPNGKYLGGVKPHGLGRKLKDAAVPAEMLEEHRRLQQDIELAQQRYRDLLQKVAIEKAAQPPKTPRRSRASSTEVEDVTFRAPSTGTPARQRSQTPRRPRAAAAVDSSDAESDSETRLARKAKRDSRSKPTNPGSAKKAKAPTRDVVPDSASSDSDDSDGGYLSSSADP